VASVVPKCNGMENWLALVLSMRPCNVDKVSAGSATDHAGMSRSIFQHGRIRLSCFLSYHRSGVSRVRTGGQCQQSLWPTAWHVLGAAWGRGAQ
jgi:hypothetical protein